MLTEKEVIEIAKKNIKEIEKKIKKELVVFEELSIKKPYGIIFFYNTKKLFESRDERDNTLVGGGPFLVEYKTGNIVEFGSNRSEDYYIQEYEAGRYP